MSQTTVHPSCIYHHPPLASPTGDWWATAFDSEAYACVAPMLRDEAETAADLTHLPRWLELAPGATLLDVGCGDGRLAVPLAQAGYDVIALDHSEVQLQAARQRAAQAGVTIEFVQGDMRECPVRRRADAAICANGVFGVFTGDVDHKRALQAINLALKPRGRLYLETDNREHPVVRLPDSRWSRLGSTIVTVATEVDHWFSRRRGTVNVAREGESMAEVLFDYRLFTPWELISLAEACGFAVAEVNGGSGYPDYFAVHSSRTLAVVLVKGKEAGAPLKPAVRQQAAPAAPGTRLTTGGLRR